MFEPDYTKQYSNDTVCNYFYYLSIIVLAIGVISLFLHTWGFFAAPSKFMVPIIVSLVLSLIQLGIVYYIYLFSYLVCTRSLLDK